MKTWLNASTAALALVAFSPDFVAAQTDLIEQGRELFFNETFDGNGRTCGSCHPAENNFTVDAKFLATVRGNDPVFTAAPRLRGQLRELEVRRLLRGDALFLENLDTFDNPGVLRSVPHTLALRTSLRGNLGTTHALGWSGDGSPGSGSLREFAIGAVVQHFPRDPQRREGIDFRLPTAAELDAMEAFQLSLGRQEDVNITPGTSGEIVFTDPVAEAGKALFNDAPSRDGRRACAGCHMNAGANTPDGINGNFDTGIALLPNAPACKSGFSAPGDGGFGLDPVDTVSRRDLCGNGPAGGPHATATFRGDGTFNAPPLVEAADTPPFFHNNAIATLEEAIRFYTSDVFHASPAGSFGGAFVLGGGDVNAIGAMLRALNAMENIRSANAYAEDAMEQTGARAEESVRLSIAETTDAIEVLTSGAQPYRDTEVVPLLQDARALEQDALGAGLPAAMLEEAIALRNDARAIMVE